MKEICGFLNVLDRNFVFSLDILIYIWYTKIKAMTGRSRASDVSRELPFGERQSRKLLEVVPEPLSEQHMPSSRRRYLHVTEEEK